MTLNNKILALEASATNAVVEAATRLREEGHDLIPFGAGEPDFPTPPHIIEHAHKAMLEGKTRYTPASGTRELKSAFAHRLATDTGLEYEAEQVLVSNGGKHSLYNATMTLFQEGDEVIIVAPYWVTYPEIIKLAGASVVVLETGPEANYQIDQDALESLVSPRTKGIFLNSPSNPSGAVLNKASLEAVVASANKHNYWILSDEVYGTLVYDGEHISPASLPGGFDRTVTIHSMSKSFAMTGWRMGFTCGPQNVMDAMSKFQGQITGCPNAIAQSAAAFALRGDQSFRKDWLVEFRRRRDHMVAGLNEIPDVKCPSPAGAFYSFPDFSAYLGRAREGVSLKDSSTLARYLLETAHVVIMPGAPFGAEGFLRLSYATSMKNVERGIDRMRKALEELN